jgi:ABC-type glycerol-3-phosphate transport system substrate-binding protein
VAGRLYQTLVLQPILKGAADRPFFKEDRAMQAFLVQPADVFPLHVRAHDMEIVMGKAVEAALQQKGSPKQVLDAAAKEVADLLAQD